MSLIEFQKIFSLVWPLLFIFMGSMFLFRTDKMIQARDEDVRWMKKWLNNKRMSNNRIEISVFGGSKQTKARKIFVKVAGFIFLIIGFLSLLSKIT